MKPSAFRTPSLLFMASILAGSTSIVTADPAIPDPCTLITVEEMQQIVGPLDGAPSATDPASGEITCSYTPKTGPSFIVVTLHGGEHEDDLARLRQGEAYKDAVSLPEFGKDAFVTPNAHEYTDLYAKKGNLILEVSLPMGPDAVATAKSIAAKAWARL